MAAPQSSMTLDGFIVEKVDNQAGQTQEVSTEQAGMTMPEPSVPVGVGGFVMPQVHATESHNLTRLEMPTPFVAAEPAPAVSAEKEDVREIRRSGSSSSSSSGSKKDDEEEKKHKHHHHHHHGGKDAEKDDRIASIPYDLKHDKIVSTEAPLSSDPKTLAAFLKLHGELRPSFTVHLSGTHTEHRTRVVRNADGKGSHTETYTETVTDFSFSIDLAPLLTEEPVIYSVSDDTPALRGGMRMAVETGGARPIERRTIVESSVQDKQENAMDAARRVGLAPWLVSANPSPDLEAAYGSTPQASSRTFEE